MTPLTIFVRKEDKKYNLSIKNGNFVWLNVGLSQESQIQDFKSGPKPWCFDVSRSSFFFSRFQGVCPRETQRLI